RAEELELLLLTPSAGQGHGLAAQAKGAPSPSPTPSSPRPEAGYSKVFFAFFFSNSGEPSSRPISSTAALLQPVALQIVLSPSLRRRRRSKRWLRPCQSPSPTTLRL
ncbi:unnamed protein product, partial [Urochloa humidicola]